MNKSIIIVFTISVVTFFFTIGCGSAKNNPNSSELMFIPSEDTIIRASVGEVPSINPTTTINRVRLEGNILYLEVTYTGGCKEQDFGLIGENALLNTDEKVPARKVVLYRDSKGDMCRELITRELWFNLEELTPKDEVGGRVNLLLKGVDDPFFYVRY